MWVGLKAAVGRQPDTMFVLGGLEQDPVAGVAEGEREIACTLDQRVDTTP
jgi:hypothetical protein